jgi:CDP-diacylglycerol--glycerol-3-phosphate 3-phosphatidyltransferase
LFGDKMTIYALKSRFQGLLRPMVRRLSALGVTANQVTIAACLLSVVLGLFLIAAARDWFLILPIWMLLRMALNAVDGMLAREFGQKSPLGAYLNELTDVVSDAALYLPFAFIPPFDWRSVGAVIFIASLTEMTGVVGVMAGASRRYDGPMGKSDRAFVFSLLAIWVATTTALPGWTSWIMWTIALAATITIVNRIRSGLREVNDSKPAGNKEQAT